MTPKELKCANEAERLARELASKVDQFAEVFEDSATALGAEDCGDYGFLGNDWEVVSELKEDIKRLAGKVELAFAVLDDARLSAIWGPLST